MRRSSRTPPSTPTALVAALRLILDERGRSEKRAVRRELILTGPEIEGAEARETRVVVRDLFESAKRSALIVGYAFHDSDQIFEPLARRMSRNSRLRVRLVVNVHFERGRSADPTIRAYGRGFLKDHWPFEPRPEIYFDRRPLDEQGSKRGNVHAKLIVIDEESLYVGSANFTAFERNIELGLRIKSAALAVKATEQFDRWIDHGDLAPLPLADATPQ